MLCKTWKILPDVDKLDETSREEIGQNRFSRQKIAFLENIFWRLSYSYRNDLISYKLYSKCQMTSWTLIKCFLRFVILINTRWKKLNFFSLECLPFFLFFSKYSVFNNLSGLWELTFLLAPNLLEYFVERDKIVMDVRKTRYYERKDQSFFFIEKVTFSREFWFLTFTQLLQMWSCNLHKSCLNLILSLKNCFLMYTQ